SALTRKDHSDLEAALDAGVDWIALSFVQRPEDIAEAKKIARGRAAVMAKMEKPQAVERLSEIIDAADALMVARGDLGVELPVEKVPALQKQMTRAARRAGKPVVVATQMLESMISSPVPTRAEVSDVATAIYEGADAVMLSAESASGQFPVEAVATMDRIAVEVETDTTYHTIIDAQRTEPEATGADAIAAAAREIAETPISTRSCAGPSPAPPRCGWPASGRGRQSFRFPQTLQRAASSPWRGAYTAWLRRMPAIRTTWSTAPAALPLGKNLRRSASASSWWRACRSERRGPPTWC